MMSSRREDDYSPADKPRLVSTNGELARDAEQRKENQAAWAGPEHGFDPQGTFQSKLKWSAAIINGDDFAATCNDSRPHDVAAALGDVLLSCAPPELELQLLVPRSLLAEGNAKLSLGGAAATALMRSAALRQPPPSSPRAANMHSWEEYRAWLHAAPPGTAIASGADAPEGGHGASPRSTGDRAKRQRVMAMAAVAADDFVRLASLRVARGDALGERLRELTRALGMTHGANGSGLRGGQRVEIAPASSPRPRSSAAGVPHAFSTLGGVRELCGQMAHFAADCPSKPSAIAFELSCWQADDDDAAAAEQEEEGQQPQPQPKK